MSLRYVVHPFAQECWVAWKSSRTQEPGRSHPCPRAALMLTPIHCVLDEKSGDVLFFGGFSAVDLAIQNKEERVILVRHDQPSKEEIRILACSNLVQSICERFDASAGYASLHQAINALPAAIRSEFFGRARVSARFLAELGGINPRTVEHQIGKKSQQERRPEMSLLDRVLQDVDTEG